MLRRYLPVLLLIGCAEPPTTTIIREELTPYKVAISQMTDVTTDFPVVITGKTDGLSVMVMYDSPQLFSDNPNDPGFKTIRIPRGVPTPLIVPTKYACSRYVEDISLININGTVYNPYEGVTAEQLDDIHHKFPRVGGIEFKIIQQTIKNPNTVKPFLDPVLATFYINDVDIGILPVANHFGSTPKLAENNGGIVPRKNLGSDQWKTLFAFTEFLPCP